MSDNLPPGDPNQIGRGPVEHLQAGAGQPLAPSARRGRSRRVAVVGGLALTGALVGGGVWAWQAWFSQGPQPAEALPASTLAYASIDLDPSGSQKIEAIRFLRKFPAFKDEIGLDTDDDVRKEIFSRIQDEGACEDLDYADDIEPWLGDRFAVAAVDRGEDSIAPVLVAQIKDEDKAASGLDKLVECGNQAVGEDDIGGYAFNGDWVILAETEDIATDVVKDAKDESLSGDADYTKWTEAAGDPGIITLYASPDAGKAFAGFLEDLPFLFLGGGQDYAYSDDGGSFEYGDDGGGSVEDAVPPPAPADPQSEVPTATPGEKPSEATPEVTDEQTALPPDLPSDFPTSTPSTLEASPVDPDIELDEDLPDTTHDGDFEQLPSDDEALPEELRETFEDFPGGAGTLRFDGGNLELELASGNLPGSWNSLLDGDKGADVLSTLPETTAAALGAGFQEGWVQDLIDQLAPMIEDEAGMSVDDAIAEFESETGLSVPEDLEALGGESFAIAFDSGFDADAFEEEDITRVPVGAKIKGDPEKIEAALDKIRATIGSDGDMLLSRTEDGYVLVSASEDYLDRLADAGDLGSSSAFEGMVAEADDASAILFVNFDAGDNWLDDLVADLDAPEDVRENVKPLEALGISTWLDGDESHSLVKLTTD